MYLAKIPFRHDCGGLCSCDIEINRQSSSKLGDVGLRKVATNDAM